MCVVQHAASFNMPRTSRYLALCLGTQSNMQLQPNVHRAHFRAPKYNEKQRRTNRVALPLITVQGLTRTGDSQRIWAEQAADRTLAQKHDGVVFSTSTVVEEFASPQYIPFRVTADNGFLVRNWEPKQMPSNCMFVLDRHLPKASDFTGQLSLSTVGCELLSVVTTYSYEVCRLDCCNSAKAA